MNRRDFLTKAGAAVAAATILPPEVFGKSLGGNHIAPSDRIHRGVIGVGGIGRSSSHFFSNEGCPLIALCDVDSSHLASAGAAARERLGVNPKGKESDCAF